MVESFARPPPSSLNYPRECLKLLRKLCRGYQTLPTLTTTYKGIKGLGFQASGSEPLPDYQQAQRSTQRNLQNSYECLKCACVTGRWCLRMCLLETRRSCKVPGLKTFMREPDLWRISKKDLRA